MSETIVKDGKKYVLVPYEDEPTDPLASLVGSEPLWSGTSEADDEAKNELPDDIVLVDTTPVVKNPKEMLMETAQRLAQARVSKVSADVEMRRQYEGKVGADVRNTTFFYGDGSTEATSRDSDEL